MRREEEKETGGCSRVWMVHGSCGEGRQKPKGSRGRRRCLWGTRAKGACSRAGTRRVPVPAGQGRDAWSRALQGQQVKQHIQDPGAAELGGKKRAAAWCRLRCSEEWQQTVQHGDVTQVWGRAGRELLCRQRTDHSCLGKGLA